MDTKKMTTSAVSALGTGMVIRYMPHVPGLKGDFTDWVTASALGIIGIFGAYSGKGMWEDVSKGVLDGSAAYFGIKFSDMITKTTSGTTTPPATTGYYGATPRLIGYGKEKNSWDEEMNKPKTGTKSFIEI